MKQIRSHSSWRTLSLWFRTTQRKEWFAGQQQRPPGHALLVSALFTMFLSLGFVMANAQSSGYINRPATIAAGRLILDPNSDTYSSKGPSGYQGDDVNNSEIPYRPMPSFSKEPFGDLRRGPDHRFSDFVPDVNNLGYYTYFTGTNMLFRFRMGSVMSGSKGYSVLIDTDNKFGSSGPNADPDYQPETTGVNGNPGFEIEVVLETNFRIAIYNVNGPGAPSLIKSYTNWQDMSQVSIAGTSDNGDPDFFIDFYIPFSDLQAAPFNLTTSTPLRMCATTVMAPKGAIGGPKSDIYGSNDGAYKSTNQQYEDYIKSLPTFKPSDLTSGGIGGPCTAAPTVNSPLPSGSQTVSGTWVRSAITNGPSTAVIVVYKNGVMADSVKNVSSGSTWTSKTLSLVNGDVITAKAVATGESMCLVSNSVTAMSCNPGNTPTSADLYITCSSTRGLEGSLTSGKEISVFYIDPATLVASSLAGPAANSPTFGYSGSNWYYNGTKYNGNAIPSACSGGTQDMNDGVYYITATYVGGSCPSVPQFGCVGLTNTTAKPTFSQTRLTPSNTQVSGTAPAGAQVRLYINGQPSGTATATGGAFSFPGLTLQSGDKVHVFALAANQCASTADSLVVGCNTNAPVITLDNNSQLVAGKPITGTSGEPTGTTVTVYSVPAAQVATATVQSDGSWATTFNAVSGTSYYALAKNGTCNTSVSSDTAAAIGATTNRCGTITGPVTSASASIGGTLTGGVTGTVVNIYMDGQKVGSVTTGVATWSILTSALTYPLYNNAILTIGVQESGKAELYCSSAPLTVTCNSGPPTPVFSPSSSTIYPGSKQTYTINNAVPGSFYGLCDSASGKSLGTGVWATSSTVTLTTNSFANGTYKLMIKGTTISGVNVCSTPGITGMLVVNATDIDDDNDGIPDLAEYGGIDPMADADSDGIPNYQDPTPGSGVPSWTDANGDGINDAYDADKDGTINSLDLDSDNDGIADIVEAGGVDTNGDGQVDGTVDADNDGLIDLYDSDKGGVDIANLDTDGDGVKNAYDLDSDNDGIPDVVEAGGVDANNDGLIDNIIDTDNDGFIDAKDGDVGNDGTAENTANALIITGTDGNADGKPDSYPRANLDGTGLPNPYDLDADGDGILDTREAGLPDSDNNGIADGTLGADGWSDTVDALASLNLLNTDGSGKANHLDIDADDDGIVDNIEAQSTTGYLAPLDTDTDGDGIDNRYDNNNAAFGGNAANGITPVNTDGADLPDYLDMDSDNDGYSDRLEGWDTNGNNVLAGAEVKFVGTGDADGDGLFDEYDNNDAATNPTNGTTPTSYPNADKPSTTERDWREISDLDGDGISDLVDIDDDNDGIPDLKEFNTGTPDPLADADGDGIANFMDSTPGSGVPAWVDANGDGVNDAYDSDKDGIINSFDLDSDNDGIADIVEAGGVDTNGDGRVDVFTDPDNDGLATIYDSNNGGVDIANLDTDGDGVKNAYDLDADNDGIPDVVEAGGIDSNNDGLIDSYTDTDGDGFIDAKDGDVGNDGTAENTANALIITGVDANSDGKPDSYPRANGDKTGMPNPYDLDADDDGILDTREAGLADANNDGIADGTLGADGWSDVVDALASLNLPNTDSRGAANYLDIDSDDDGLPDNVEGQTTAGYILPSGSDSDGDGIDDSYDNNDAAFAGNANNGITPNNHDGVDNPDYTDLDTDNDGVNDLKEGTGNLSATLTNTADSDGDGLLDQFDTFDESTQTSNLQNNVTLIGMGANGAATGPVNAGSNVIAKQSNPAATNRDWRNVSVVLPMHLLQFSAEKTAGNARLKWKTANETAMKNYVLERSVDGTSFSQVATIAAKGGAANAYEVVDNISQLTAAKVYYRLQQVEGSGSVSYSNIVSLSLTQADATTVAVTPNPARGPVTLTVKSTQSGSGRVMLIDNNGRTLAVRSVAVGNGSNQFYLEAGNQLPNGSYLVRFELNGETQTTRFVIQR